MLYTKFKSINIIEGIYYRKIFFTPLSNLVTSNGENSTGKTTLIRLLLYGIGYPIPSTKGINFDNCHVEVEMIINDQELLIVRDNDDVSIIIDNKESYFVLPHDLIKILSFLFKEDNIDILENLLGAFYIDQDRGWTLLNRGKVVGDIRFNIERLVRGLANRSCFELEIEQSHLEKEIQKYNQMLKIGEYQEQYLHKQTSLVSNDKDEQARQQAIQLKIQKQEISKELKRIESIIQKNLNFEKYIEDMKLTVKASSGEEIPVTKNTLIGFLDNLDIQKVRAKMLSHEIADLEKKLSSLEEKILYSTIQDNAYSDSLFRSTSNDQPISLIEAFDVTISSVPINVEQVKKTINQLKARVSEIKKIIIETTKTDNEVVIFLNSIINKYAHELGVQEYILTNGVFTNVLKSLSGTIYHKIVFAFRLAYIKAVEQYAALNLPIIIDSPSGREMNQINVDQTLEILKRDFSHHQIILASINEYPIFSDANKILIVDRLVNKVQS